MKYRWLDLSCLAAMVWGTQAATYTGTSSTVVSAFRLRLPGGRGIVYDGNTGVLRIDLEGRRWRGNTHPTKLPAPPPEGTTPSSKTLDAIRVRHTGCAGKGHGAFATAPFDAGTFLGFYEGEVVRTREALERRYGRQQRPQPDDGLVTADATNKGAAGGELSGSSLSLAMMEYVISLDGGATFLDGRERAMDRTVFTPAHLNHKDRSRPGCNCVRVLDENGKRVAFFTSRLVLEGEELCFDYGSNFWEGREHLKQ